MRILLVHLGGAQSAPEDDLHAILRDFGHDVRLVTDENGPPDAWEGFHADVLVARLETDSARALDFLSDLTSKPPLVGAPILVTGRNELAIIAARRRFPEASFARLDTVQTALASMEAGE